MGRVLFRRRVAPRCTNGPRRAARIRRSTVTMENSSDDVFLRIVLGLALALLALAALATLARRLGLRARVGKPWASESSPRAWRYVGIAAALGAASVLASDPTSNVLALSVLALVIAVLLTAPALDDVACGERGVRRGWHARSFGELEEWRLTGEHVRWRLFGDWNACSVPKALHPELRATLERLAPGRESPFKD